MSNETPSIYPPDAPQPGDTNVVQLDRHAWKAKERSLKALGQQQRVVVKGGARMVKFNVTMPFGEFKKMCERFQGKTPGDKVNMLARIANQRIDQLEREQVAKALEGTIEPPKVPT